MTRFSRRFGTAIPWEADFTTPDTVVSRYVSPLSAPTRAALTKDPPQSNIWAQPFPASVTAAPTSMPMRSHRLARSLGRVRPRGTSTCHHLSRAATCLPVITYRRFLVERIRLRSGAGHCIVFRHCRAPRGIVVCRRRPRALPATHDGALFTADDKKRFLVAESFSL